jgi:hypothetical protein
VAWPLFISSRLMAAYRIENVGILHLHTLGRDDEGRVRYRYVIEDADGVELEDGDDLRSGVGASLDYPATMATLLAFLEHAAESNEANGGDGDHLFAWPVIEWARQHSDELGVARLDLDEAREVGCTRRVYLDLSTRHLPQEEMERLRDWPRECPVRVIPHEYGAWVNVPPADPGGNENGDPLADTGKRWTDLPHLRAVLQQARHASGDWINLDTDADGLIPHLPIFLW